MIKSCMDRQPDTVAGQGDGSHRQPPIDSGKFVHPAGNSMAKGDTVEG